MKTLLIPTDFNLRSLNCITTLVQQHQPHEINILLVHMMKITDNIQELLMLSRRSAEHQHISNDFYNACNQLKQKHAHNVNSIRIEFFYGSTVAVFKNFLEANEVNSIVMLQNYNYQMLNKNSIQPFVLVSRCGLEIIHADCVDPIYQNAVNASKILVEENI